MKTSIIKDVSFTGNWTAPNGDILYYHNLVLENGDTGSVATAEKYASKIEVGKEVTYILNGTKMKLQQPEGANNTPSTYSGNNSARKKTYSRSKSASDFLGYSCSYAKDLVIAGKTKKTDVEAYKRIAKEIYAHVQQLLNDENNENQG
jgi:hypothetical protein